MKSDSRPELDVSTDHPSPSWLRLVRDVVTHSRRHEITAEAARLAYYLLLSLFPFLLTIFALTGIFGGDDAFAWIVAQIEATLPQPALEPVESLVRGVTSSSRPGVLSVGVLVTLWASSNALAALADGLNRAYRVRQRHRWWKKRLQALLLIVVGALALVASAAVLLAGPELARFTRIEGLGGILRWPLLLAVVLGMMVLMYYFLPNYAERRWKRGVLAGAVTATVLWSASVVLFRRSVAAISGYSAGYGVVGGFMLLLIWCFLTALVVLLGGELAAALERRWNGIRAD